MRLSKHTGTPDILDPTQVTIRLFRDHHPLQSFLLGDLNNQQQQQPQKDVTNGRDILTVEDLVNAVKSHVAVPSKNSAEEPTTPMPMIDHQNAMVNIDGTPTHIGTQQLVDCGVKEESVVDVVFPFETKQGNDADVDAGVEVEGADKGEGNASASNSEDNDSSSTEEDTAAGDGIKTEGKKRGQRGKYTRRACSNCRLAHAACDEGRPCKRCVDLGKEDSCVDAERKKTKRRTQRAHRPSIFEQTEHVYEQLTDFMPMLGMLQLGPAPEMSVKSEGAKEDEVKKTKTRRGKVKKQEGQEELAQRRRPQKKQQQQQTDQGEAEAEDELKNKKKLTARRRKNAPKKEVEKKGKGKARGRKEAQESANRTTGIRKKSTIVEPDNNPLQEEKRESNYERNILDDFDSEQNALTELEMPSLIRDHVDAITSHEDPFDIYRHEDLDTGTGLDFAINATDTVEPQEISIDHFFSEEINNEDNDNSTDQKLYESSTQIPSELDTLEQLVKTPTEQPMISEVEEQQLSEMVLKSLDMYMKQGNVPMSPVSDIQHQGSSSSSSLSSSSSSSSSSASQNVNDITENLSKVNARILHEVLSSYGKQKKELKDLRLLVRQLQQLVLSASIAHAQQQQQQRKPISLD